MTLSRKINHDFILAAMYAIALVLMVTANVINAYRGVAMSPVDVLWTVGITVGAVWYGRKVLR